jgi:hypothetical protein
LDWADLFNAIRPRLDLKGNGQPDGEGWVAAHCIDAANHRNGDQHPSLRINVTTGGVKCMSQGCPVGPNLNTLAERLGIETRSEDGRQGTLNDLALPRKLSADTLLKVWGVRAERRGWTIPIDDPDAQGFQRIKRYPWARGPKYHWTPKGCKAADLVYNISRLDSETEEVFIAAGEPDTWVLAMAELPVVSFLAGENAAPSAKAIEKLKARAPKLKTVHLLYDWDDAGRRGAHKVGATLLAAGLAVEIAHLPDDLPEGGDVTDLWVSCDGDREAFLRRLYGLDTEWLKVQGPQVEQQDDDRFLVSLPCERGWVRFDFNRISRGRQRLEAELSITVELPGVSGDPYAAGINLLSVSGREALRRQLEQVHPDLPWAALINGAFVQLRTACFGADPSLDLATVEARSPDTRYRVETLLPEGQATVFLGDGSTGKTYISLMLALSIATGEPLLGLDVIPARVLFVDYETDAENLRFRLDRLLAGFGLSWQPGLVDYWAAKGRPFPDIVDAVRQKVRQDDIGLVIIDSAAAACGGEPEKAEIALTYFNSLARLGVTTQTIAHVTKDSDDRKPFGSVFWHNMARATWYVKRVQDEGEDMIHVGMFHRKSNDARLAKPLGLRIAFEGETGPVAVEREDVRDVPELEKSRPLKQRILERLKQGAMHVEGLAQELDEPPNKIRARLSEMKGQVQAMENPGGSNTRYWGLRERYWE